MRTNLEILITSIAKGRGFQDTQKHLQGLEKGAKGLKSNLEVGLGVIKEVGFAAGVMGATFKTAFDLSKEGAQILTTAGQLDRLAVSIGTTAGAITGELSMAMGGMMTDAQIAASATQLISLGLANTQEETVRLATLVGKLGWDMQQVILTFANNSKMRLDALGLSVTDVQTRTERLVAAGYSMDKAFDMAVIEAGEAKLELLGDQTDTATGAVLRFETRIANATDTVKVWLAEGLVPWLELASGGYETKIVEALQQEEERVLSVAQSYEEYVRAVAGAKERAGEIIAFQRRGIETLLELGEFSRETAQGFGMLTRAQFESAQTMGEASAIADGWANSLGLVRMEVVEQESAVRDYSRALQGASISAEEEYWTLQESIQAHVEHYRQVQRDKEAQEEYTVVMAAAAEGRAMATAALGDLFSDLANLGAGGLDRQIAEISGELADLYRHHGQVVTVAASSEQAHTAAALAMYRAEDAASRLSAAEKKLAENADPEAQRALEIAVLRAREAIWSAQENAGELNEALTAGGSHVADYAGNIAKLEAELETLEIRELTLAMYEAADGAGASVQLLSALAVQTGELSKEEAKAIVTKVALIEKAQQLGEALAAGKVSVGEALEELRDFQTTLQEMPDERAIELKVEIATDALAELERISAEPWTVAMTPEFAVEGVETAIVAAEESFAAWEREMGTYQTQVEVTDNLDEARDRAVNLYEAMDAVPKWTKLLIRDNFPAVHERLSDVDILIEKMPEEFIVGLNDLDSFGNSIIELERIDALTQGLDGRQVDISVNVAGGGGTGAVPGRQHGGSVSAGGVYMVGEAGPELFSPSTAGQITPNDQLSRPGGGMVWKGDLHIHDARDPKATAREVIRVLRDRGMIAPVQLR